MMTVTMTASGPLWVWVVGAAAVVGWIVILLWPMPPAPCPRCGALKGCDCDFGLAAGEE